MDLLNPKSILNGKRKLRMEEKYPLTYNKNSKSLKPQFVIEQICELTKVML